jgi:hypothetical protein
MAPRLRQLSVAICTAAAILRLLGFFTVASTPTDFVDARAMVDEQPAGSLTPLQMDSSDASVHGKLGGLLFLASMMAFALLCILLLLCDQRWHCISALCAMADNSMEAQSPALQAPVAPVASASPTP